jgi:hypothetical protein
MGTKDKLSYERLISRVEYYKEKALDLEKKLLFAEESIDRLENETNTQDSLLIIEQKDKELSTLQEEVKKLTAKIQKLNDSDYEKKIKGYDELLNSIQEEINDKDQQIDLYQQRIKSMEKRININRTSEPVLETDESEPSEADENIKKELNCISYFDYSVIFTHDRTGFIRGSFYIENIGSKTLDNPYICFRFQPAEAIALKGKIISLLASPTQEEMSQSIWMYMDNEWADKARERGEIWICPLRETRQKSGERIALTDFQIPIKSKIDETITVEAFVYYHKQNYRAKAVNHIAVNF